MHYASQTHDEIKLLSICERYLQKYSENGSCPLFKQNVNEYKTSACVCLLQCYKI